MPKKATKQSADMVAEIDAKIQGVIADIDAQIGKLEDKKAALLSLFGAAAANEKRRGRPKGSRNVTKKAVAKAGKKRVFSAETKKKLKEAAKARWAKARAEKAKTEKAKAA
ncbi:MAG: hypothetical protein HYR56_07370 [Acidobacteria bacterium]|nr:hypothetical protein [Acidobacteriota bacterium]MBI3425148.1 hypothetical protein [Acidobacteriota bacterium]